jgi:hypothetical protein
MRLGRSERFWKHAIGKKPSVKVIEFMLKDACRPSFEGPGFPLAIRLKSFDLDRPVAANNRLKTGNADPSVSITISGEVAYQIGLMTASNGNGY